MDNNQFVEQVDISTDPLGHHPYYLMVYPPEGSKAEGPILNALAHLPNIQSAYHIVNTYMLQFPGCKMQCSFDFPAVLDVETDFVGCFFLEFNSRKWEGVLVPYNTKGEKLPVLTTGAALQMLIWQININCPRIGGAGFFKLQKLTK